MDVKDVGGGLSVSSDGCSVLYTTVVHTSGDQMLVESFRRRGFGGGQTRI